MTTYYIDPTARPGGNGTFSHPFNSWSSVNISAGNTYLQKAGTSANASLYIGAHGSAAAPITIGAYGNGTPPVINGGINLANASYVTVKGVAPQNANGAAIVLQQGANHIMIDSTLLSHSVMGIWMGNAAGSDNIIRNNTITGNSNDGIAIDKIANPAGHATQITGNTITNNGIHGIELDGNNFVVSGNTVNGNGLYSAGASGIHVYGGAEGSPDGYGVGNTVTNNVTVGNHDLWAQDGNGIELDQYTHNNVVSNNFSAGNDGAGIAVYDSYGNTVANNTLVGNELDAGHTHTARGDLALNAHIGITANNIFSGNTGIANANSAAVFISSTSQSNNQFSANAWENQAGGPATQLGIDTSWASWLQYQGAGSPLATADRNTGVALTTETSTAPLSYAYPSGTIEMINGTPYILVGWTQGRLVVA